VARRSWKVRRLGLGAGVQGQGSEVVCAGWLMVEKKPIVLSTTEIYRQKNTKASLIFEESCWAELDALQ